MSNQITQFIQEGKNMLDSGNVEDYGRWKDSILFFVERYGTSTMIDKVKKEVNRSPLFITFPGDPTDLGKNFYDHKIEQIKKIISLVEALAPYLTLDTSQRSTKSKRDKKRFFSESVKNHVWDRQQGKCAKCENQLNRVATEYDHKVAWEEGGLSTEENCQAFCANCHKIKTNDDRLKKQKITSH